MNGWLGLLVVGLLLPLVVNEFGDVSHWLARRVLAWGARRLGASDMVERYTEEWQADLECVPGRLTKLGYALGVVVWGVPRLRLQIRLRHRRQPKVDTPEKATEVSAGTRVPPWEGLARRERHAVCIAEAKNGDKRAFDVLIAELTPLVWHVARGNRLNRNAAEEVTQDVWLELVHTLGSFDEPRGLTTWLITSTRRLARQRRTDDASAENHRPDVDDKAPVLRQAHGKALWRAFHRLPSSSQELLRLTVLASREYYDVVAIELGLEAEQVVAARGEALGHLRRLYGDEIRHEGLAHRPGSSWQIAED